MWNLGVICSPNMPKHAQTVFWLSSWRSASSDSGYPRPMDSQRNWSRTIVTLGKSTSDFLPTRLRLSLTSDILLISFKRVLGYCGSGTTGIQRRLCQIGRDVARYAWGWFLLNSSKTEERSTSCSMIRRSSEPSPPASPAETTPR